MRGAAAACGASTPALDLAAGLERVMGDRDLFLRVLGRFAGDYRGLPARLRAALDAGDTELALRIAHTLKGAAGMIDAARLRQLALDTELALKAGDRLPVAALDAELARVLACVDTLLAAPGTVAPAAVPAGPENLARLRDLLDVGDGSALELAAHMRPLLLATMGSDGMAAFEAALGRFDFEHALALLEQAGPAPDA